MNVGYSLLHSINKFVSDNIIFFQFQLIKENIFKHVVVVKQSHFEAYLEEMLGNVGIGTNRKLERSVNLKTVIISPPRKIMTKYLKNVYVVIV